MTTDRNSIKPPALGVKEAEEVDLLSIIDISALEALLVEFHNLTKLAFALIELDGRVLIAIGWQDICTKFHRANPVTYQHCIESDTILAAGAKLGEYKMYRCKNNLWDIAIPVVIEGRHLANLFMGQFLFREETFDYDLFRAQARKYGFQEEAYLAALEQVPRLTREEILAAINFFTKLGHMISTLGLKNVELNRAVNNYKLSQSALEASEQRYRTLVNQIPVGLCRIAPGPEGGRILMANPAFLKNFGIKHERELKHVKVADLYADAGDCKSFFALLLEKKFAFGWEFKLRKLDGTPIWGSVTASVVRNRNGQTKYVDCAIEDITQRKLAEIQLRARDELLHKLSDRVPGMIYQLQYFPDGRFCMPYASKGISDIFLAAPEEARHNLAPIIEKIHGDDLAKVAESIFESFHNFKQWDCNFRVVLPGGRLKWIRGSATPEKMEDGSVLWHGFLFDITQLKQVEEEIRARNEELGALYALSSHLRKASNTAELLPLLLNKALELFKTEHGAITLLSADRKKLTVCCGKGIWQDSVGFALSPQEGLSGRVLGTGKAYVGSSSDEGAKELLWTNLDKIGPLIMVPLQSENEPIGTLMIARSQAPDSRPFAPNEVKLLETIGDMAGSALRRQRLYEEAQRRLRQTQALRNIDMAITGSFDLRVTYNTIFDEITRQLGIDAAAILFLDPHAMTLTYEDSRGFGTLNLSNLRLRIGEGYAGKACLEKRPVLIPDLKAVEPDPCQGAIFLAEGFRSYFAFPLMAKGRTLGVLEALRRDKFDADEEWLYFLETLAGQAAIAIDDATLFHNLERANVELIQSYDATIEGWAYALDLKDEATEGHSRRVADMAVELAMEMGVKGEALSHLKRGALLHDIGKMGIPDSILHKPGKLTEEEWEIMRKHPEYAFKMLSPIEYLRPALDIPYCHHEKWDGSGYPRGLKGKEIPLAARIFAVVDMYDALTSPRPYRKAWPEEEALQYIHQQSGKHFDPEVVEIFLKKFTQKLQHQ